jgi:NAD(P)-dependent dehydrogenase (short-subunit alcohol dehydrogenase family)
LPEGKIASDETFHKIMDVNVLGTWNMGTEALPRMAKQEVKHSSGVFTGVERNVGSGAIINIASGAGFRGIPGLAVYCASKHAVIGLTRVWAKDFCPVRVNSVAPGS